MANMPPPGYGQFTPAPSHTEHGGSTNQERAPLFLRNSQSPTPTSGVRRRRQDDGEDYSGDDGAGNEDGDINNSPPDTDAVPQLRQVQDITGYPVAKRARLQSFAQQVCSEEGLERNALDDFAAVSPSQILLPHQNNRFI
jgi:hypothetical protein